MSNGQIASVFQWLAIAASITAALSGGIALHFRNKASIETAEMLSQTIGRRWAPLSDGEVDALATSLETVSKHRVQLTYVNQLGKDLAESINRAFMKATWTVVISDGGGSHFGIIAGPGSEKAGRLKIAFEQSTSLTVVLDSASQPDADNFVRLSIGINR